MLSTPSNRMRSGGGMLASEFGPCPDKSPTIDRRTLADIGSGGNRQLRRSKCQALKPR